MHTLARMVRLLAAVALVAAFLAQPATAQSKSAEPIPPKASELLRLLDDPDVRHWLER